MSRSLQLAETILDDLSAKRATLSGFISDAKKEVAKVALLFDAIEAKLTSTEASIRDFQEKKAVIEAHANGVQQLPRDLQQAILGMKETMLGQIQQGVEDIEELRESVTERLDETCAEVQEAIEACGGDVRAHMTAGVEAVQELLDGIAGAFEDRVDALLDRVAEMRENADDMAEELFENVVPGAVGAQGAAFLEGVKTLKEAGVDQLEELNRGVGAIRDKTEVLTNFVEKVKPILEIAKSI